MSLMTREDMLRELELLPAWQLRTPAPEMTAEVASVAAATEISAEISAPKVPEKPIFTHVASEHGEYLFVWQSATMSVEELQLFQNICKAMRIKMKAAEVSNKTAEILLASQVKIVIAMGETAAQALLQTTETLENLREKLHDVSTVKPALKLIATYDVTHLLANMQDKAKAWRDLCLAMQALQE